MPGSAKDDANPIGGIMEWCVKMFVLLARPMVKCDECKHFSMLAGEPVCMRDAPAFRSCDEERLFPWPICYPMDACGRCGRYWEDRDD